MWLRPRRGRDAGDVPPSRCGRLVGSQSTTETPEKTAVLWWFLTLHATRPTPCDVTPSRLLVPLPVP